LKKKLKIIKSSGLSEEYSPEKLMRSLHLSGLAPSESEEVLTKVETEIIKDDGKAEETTEQIFKKAREIVYKKSHLAGLKYSLKAAILDLGPTGFIFERFIAMALEYQGYKTKVDIILKGHCVNHEVDIYAKNSDSVILGECKFHNIPNVKNDLKTALYVKARMDDLKENKENKFNEFYLISNTSFSKDAIQYAHCSGLRLIGFNYPEKKNLYDLIEENYLYPITSLIHLKKSDITMLLDKGIIICKDLCEKVDELYALGYKREDAERILADFKRISNWTCKT